jgi:uncharacterized protein YkwD
MQWNKLFQNAADPPRRNTPAMKLLFPAMLLLLLSGCASIIGGGAGDSATSINAFRAANGFGALRNDPAMSGLARVHAEDMARRESLDHAGFHERRGPAGAMAENVAYGCAESACTIKQWINSPGHRANMLLSGIGSYGVASAVSKSGRRYWALELGK